MRDLFPAAQLAAVRHPTRFGTWTVMVELSEQTQQLIRRLFSSTQRHQVAGLLESDCADNLPLIGDPDPDGLERIRFAVLRASNGEYGRLSELVSLAQKDWRNVLVAAGFAHSVDEHQKWAERVLGDA